MKELLIITIKDYCRHLWFWIKNITLVISLQKNYRAVLIDWEKLQLRKFPSFFKTLLFNLRCLDWERAKKCPIFIFPKTKIKLCTGKIHINFPASTGDIQIGFDWGFRSNGPTQIRIEGELSFNGKCKIIQGCNICVAETGHLTFGDNNLVSENVLIYCWNKITFGEYVRITYQCNIFDSDFHYTLNIDSRTIKRHSAPITIGNYVWIGNRTNIKKGTKIPDYVTVAASGTTLTKDYTTLVDKYGVLAGNPAKTLRGHICRIWNSEAQKEDKLLDQWFDTHPGEEFYQLEENENFEQYITINSKKDEYHTK